jgi:CRISPR/Cas system CSM-associated protein Csm3 (group 7 of RAMP superfamily)
MGAVPFDFFAMLESVDLPGWDRKAAAKLLNTEYLLLMAHGGDCRVSPDAEPANDEDLHGKERLKQYAHKGRSKRTPALEGAARSGMDLLQRLEMAESATWALESSPECAALLGFDFTLEKPLLTRDDDPFYPIDNPVRKDPVFRTPMISGASWKGALRAAAVENLLSISAAGEAAREERVALREIFGDEKEAEESLQADPKDALRGFLDEYLKPLTGLAPEDEQRRRGRLQCLPSYFEAIELEVINRRDRRSRAGTVPVGFETVPAGAKSRLNLSYLAFDEGPEKLEATMARDWRLIGRALYRMLRGSGFGAKKSSGHGLAGPSIENLVMRSWLLKEPATKSGAMEILLDLGATS